MLLQLDGTFLVQILNFIVFWVLLTTVFIAPTRRAIAERQRYVAELYRTADESGREAAALQAQADDILNTARRQTDESLRQAAAEAARIAHDIERQAGEDAAATVQLAHATVASERAQALEKQRAFVQELAQSMVKRATTEVA